MRQKLGSIGGVESHSARLVQSLEGSFAIQLLRGQGPNWANILALPGFYRRAARSDSLLVHCDDALTALIGPSIRTRTGQAVVATIHGHDVTMPIPWYQKMMGGALINLAQLTLAVPNKHMGRLEDCFFVMTHIMVYAFMENVAG